MIYSSFKDYSILSHNVKTCVARRAARGVPLSAPAQPASGYELVEAGLRILYLLLFRITSIFIEMSLGH